MQLIYSQLTLSQNQGMMSFQPGPFLKFLSQHILEPIPNSSRILHRSTYKTLILATYIPEVYEPDYPSNAVSRQCAKNELHLEGSVRVDVLKRDPNPMRPSN
ncbi:protein of unknown function [Methylorubrum extorquens]|uniref:Uncharacterized protein n=1 Tax=Methylorubrum extorquens TaxID=408 RepID=A0A2N9AMK2_METEX|nr:protein of unknown function [Methylorubrum extorquens]